MIRITANMVPYGLGSEYAIASVDIINTGDHENRPLMGNYKVLFYNSDGKEIRRVSVKDHLRSTGFWPILQRAMEGYGNEA